MKVLYTIIMKILFMSFYNNDSHKKFGKLENESREESIYFNLRLDIFLFLSKNDF